MTLDNQNTENDRAIQAAADKLISQAAAKNGMTIDQIPQSAKDEAYRYAAESLASATTLANNPSHQLYLQAKQENEALKTALGAVRENRAAKAADTRTVDTMEQVRGRMGHAAWFQLSEAGKLTALGLDPNTVDRAQLRTFFGRNTDTAAAVDFSKVNGYRYKQLRQAALALNITGK